MPQRQHGLHGPDEALHVFLVLGELRLEHLEGDEFVRLRVLGAEQHAGAALGEDRFEGVVRQRLADEVVEHLGPAGRDCLRGRGDGAHLGGVAQLKAQLRGADANDIAARQFVLGHRLAVDQGAAGADVDEHEFVTVPLDLTMDARDGGVGQLGGGGLAAADLQRLAGHERKRSALVGTGRDDELRGHGQFLDGWRCGWRLRVRPLSFTDGSRSVNRFSRAATMKEPISSLPRRGGSSR